MSIEFKTYRIEKVGKMIKDSKKKHIWKLKYNNKYYEIKAMESLMSGMFRIMVQDDKIYSAKINDDHKRRGLELEYDGLNLKFKKISEQIDLYVNMNRFVPNTNVTGNKMDAFKVELNVNKFKPALKSETKKPTDNEMTSQMIEKSISESYLVYDKDFDDSDEDERFDNFGEKEKHQTKTSNFESGTKSSFKDVAFNPSNLQNKNSDPKANIQLSFKKSTQSNIVPIQAPITNHPNNYPPQGFNREVQKSNAFVGFADTEPKLGSDFLSFDFSAKAQPIVQNKPPVQQRSNHNQLNFGWNNQMGALSRNDAFADSNEIVPAPSPNVNKQNLGLSNSGVKNQYGRSPMDKGANFNFNFADNNNNQNSQSKPKENPNSNSKTILAPQPATGIDPFADFLSFNNSPAQPVKQTQVNQNNFEFDVFGFEAKNVNASPFKDFGFGQNQPMANVQNVRNEPHKQFSETSNFVAPTQNLKSSSGNFGQPMPSPAIDNKTQAFFTPPQKVANPPVNINLVNTANLDPFSNNFANNAFSQNQLPAQISHHEPSDPFKTDLTQNQWTHQNKDDFPQNQNNLQPTFEPRNFSHPAESDPFSSDPNTHYVMANEQQHFDHFGNNNNNQNMAPQEQIGVHQTDPFKFGGDHLGENLEKSVSDNQFQNYNQNFGNNLSNPVAFEGSGFDNFGMGNEKKNDSGQFDNFGFGN